MNTSSPGIEITWISRNTAIYSEPFRIKHKKLPKGDVLSLSEDLSQGMEPGDLSRYMALPWQADFNECSAQPIGNASVWWWPAQRPYSVFPVKTPTKQVFWTRSKSDPSSDAFDHDLQMVTNWKDLGFILNIASGKQPQFVEIERNDQAIDNYKAPPTS